MGLLYTGYCSHLGANITVQTLQTSINIHFVSVDAEQIMGQSGQTYLTINYVDRTVVRLGWFLYCSQYTNFPGTRWVVSLIREYPGTLTNGR